MPMPTPNMPMHVKKAMSAGAGGTGMSSQTIAWMSTAMPASDATLAAIVCM
jgi:hypothetical protein